MRGRSLALSGLVAFLAVVLVISQLAVAEANPRAGATAQTWHLVASPNIGAGHNDLSSVAATSAGNAWTVGSYFDGTNWRTLILHWNGTAWHRSASPNADPGGVNRDNYLVGVAATSSANAWAVGEYADGTSFRTLTLHWNGTSWHRVPSPNADPGGVERDNRLSSVAAASAGEAWAVGSYSVSVLQPQTLTLHWNGTAWKKVASPDPGNVGSTVRYAHLGGVAETSGGAVWAAGDYWDGSVNRTMILRRNGSTWSRVPSPNGASGGITRDSELWAVDASSGSNAWAVGDYYDTSLSRFRTLTLHWNGTTWKKVPSPNDDPGGSSQDNGLEGVAVTSASNAWAVGYHDVTSTTQTLVLHWNGTAWKREASPNPGNAGSTTRPDELKGVVGRSGSSAWAVGFNEGGTGFDRTLTLRCC